MIGPDGRQWPWGTILAEHRIGDFCIVESMSTNHSDRKRRKDVSFHAFYLNQSLSHSFGTLEAAITFAIAYKYQKNPNSAAYATRFIMRMIGAEDSD